MPHRDVVLGPHRGKGGGVSPAPPQSHGQCDSANYMEREPWNDILAKVTFFTFILSKVGCVMSAVRCSNKSLRAHSRVWNKHSAVV